MCHYYQANFLFESMFNVCHSTGIYNIPLCWTALLCTSHQLSDYLKNDLDMFSVDFIHLLGCIIGVHCFESDLFEAGWRIPQLFQHRPFHSGLSNIGIILSGTGIPWRCASWTLVARLVEVRLIHQYQWLNGDQYLQKTRCLGVPLLFRATVPCVEYA